MMNHSERYDKMNPQEQVRPSFMSGTVAPVVSFGDFFGNQNPIELEIGTGRPHYLFERATAVPEHNMVGIEWKARWIKQAHKRILRDNIKNVCAIHGNAWALAPALFGENSLSNITLNFPDPWWKKRHQKRRVLNDAFLNILVLRLRSKGTIFLQSDVFMLFEEYLHRLEAHPQLRNVQGSKCLLSENPMHARSHREKKCEQIGIPVYRALFERCD